MFVDTIAVLELNTISDENLVMRRMMMIMERFYRSGRARTNRCHLMWPPSPF